jgi:hypothetical protein
LHIFGRPQRGLARPQQVLNQRSTPADAKNGITKPQVISREPAIDDRFGVM